MTGLFGTEVAKIEEGVTNACRGGEGSEFFGGGDCLSTGQFALDDTSIGVFGTFVVVVSANNGTAFGSCNSYVTGAHKYWRTSL